MLHKWLIESGVADSGLSDRGYAVTDYGRVDDESLSVLSELIAKWACG